MQTNSSASEVRAVVPVSLTIKQFCERNSISKTLYRTMRANGDGPKEMRLGHGRLVRISVEAERRWVADREKQETDQGTVEARSKNCRKAGLAGLKSQRHGSKRPNRNKKAGA